MKRFLALSFGIALAASTIGAASVSAAPDAQALVSRSVIGEVSSPTTSYECNWIYLYGIWICVPV